MGLKSKEKDSKWRLDSLPLLSAKQLSQAIEQLQTRRAEIRRYPADIIFDHLNFVEDFNNHVLTVFGDLEREHRSLGLSVLSLNWNALFRNISRGLRLNPLALVIVGILFPVFASKRVLFQSLLYREIINVIAETRAIPVIPTDLRFNAFPLNKLERALLRYYFSTWCMYKNYESFMNTLSSFMNVSYSPFVVTDNNSMVSRYPEVKEKFTNFNVDMRRITLFDLLKHTSVSMNIKAYKYDAGTVFNRFNDLSSSSLINPVPNSGFLSSVIQLANCCAYVDPKWSSVYSPVKWEEESEALGSNIKAIAQNFGVYYSKAKNICLINYAYVPLSFIFGHKAYYSKIDKSFRVNSDLYTKAVSDPESNMSNQQAVSVASHMRNLLSSYCGNNFNDYYHEELDYLHSEDIWDSSFSSSVVGFNFKKVSEAYRSHKDRINSAFFSTRKIIKRPKYPNNFLEDEYVTYVNTADPFSDTVNFTVYFFYYNKKVYINFPAIDLRAFFSSYNIEPDYKIHNKLPSDVFCSVDAFAQLVGIAEDCRNAFPFKPNLEFIDWLKNLAPNATVFQRKMVIYNKERKLRAKWTSEEDDYIRENMRPFMSRDARYDFYAYLAPRTKRDVLQRAKLIRTKMLEEGVTDVSKYPRFRMVEGLNEAIVANVKEKELINEVEISDGSEHED